MATATSIPKHNKHIKFAPFGRRTLASSRLLCERYVSWPETRRRRILTHSNKIAKASISAFLLVTFSAGSPLHAWEATESNKAIALTIESTLQTKTMLEICGESELADILDSALTVLTNHYVESGELSVEDRSEMLEYFLADVVNVFSRLEISLDKQECNRLIESAKFRISSYTEIATHNN